MDITRREFGAVLGGAVASLMVPRGSEAEVLDTPQDIDPEDGEVVRLPTLDQAFITGRLACKPVMKTYKQAGSFRYRFRMKIAVQSRKGGPSGETQLLSVVAWGKLAQKLDRENLPTGSGIVVMGRLRAGASSLLRGERYYYIDCTGYQLTKEQQYV